MTKTEQDLWVRARARLNHLATTRFGRPTAVITRWHARHPDSLLARAYTRAWLSAPILTLTVRGRKSGQPRSVALMSVFRGDDIIVIAGNAGAPGTPAWFLNLRAAGDADVKVRGHRWPVEFREVIDAHEAAECKEIFARVYPGMRVYEEQAGRSFPVGVLTRKEVAT